ncbi:MAG: D-2-hydroxyacid dehydrogenase [Geminicoccaceae bacterium]|nr:D-2-hydroxyacid dehydrogenase [Geminicoccaceae bacterium]
MSGSSERLLIAHSGADLYLDALGHSHPRLDIAVARSPGELADILGGDFRPTMAFSCTTFSFARHLHRPIVESPGLRWLHVGGAGFEHFSGFDAGRILVTNGRGVLAEFQADTIMGAIIALNHDFAAFRKAQADRRFEPRAVRPLAGQKLAIVGAGAIGCALAGRARAHGLHVIAVSRGGGLPPGFDEVRPFAQLGRSLADADIVSLNLPLTDATRGLVGRPLLMAMKEDALLVNTARGAVIDEPALVAVLEEGRFRGVYLDVFESEPLSPDSPLWGMERVFLTPHCSDQVSDWEERHAAFFMDNLARRLAGEPLLNVVSAPPPS